MAHDIFISYRRSDAQHAAFALQAHLARAFGEERVFLDRNRLDAGVDWPAGLAQAISEARIVLALQGPGWLRAADEWGRRRLDDPQDWVRRELATALAAGTPVIPLVLDGFDRPRPEALDPALVGLLDHQRHPLRNESWLSDVQLLIETLAGRLQLQRLDLRPAPYGLRKPRPMLQPVALSDGEVLARLAENGLVEWRLTHQLHPWVVVGSAQELVRVYNFERFYEAVDFMAAAARRIAAWMPPHHPRWQNQWCSVQVWFSTWDVGCRVTELDLRAAADLDHVYQDHLRGRLPRPFDDDVPFR